MNCNPIASDVANQLYRRTSWGTIIHHLDLHLLSAGVLLENTVQSVLQIVCPRIVRGYHHRPERTAVLDWQFADYRRFGTIGGTRPF
jgi:hypothetical protein